MVMESYTGKSLVNLFVPPHFHKIIRKYSIGLVGSFALSAISRDLKPHNLLMDRKTMTLKIADLGLARAFTLPIKKYTHEVVPAFSFLLLLLIFKLFFFTSSAVVHAFLSGGITVACRYWPFGIEHLKSFWDLHITQLLWIFGLLAVYSVQIYFLSTTVWSMYCENCPIGFNSMFYLNCSWTCHKASALPWGFWTAAASTHIQVDQEWFQFSLSSEDVPSSFLCHCGSSVYCVCIRNAGCWVLQMKQCGQV